MTKTTVSQKFNGYDLYKIIKMNQIQFGIQKYCYPMILKTDLHRANLNGPVLSSIVSIYEFPKMKLVTFNDSTEIQNIEVLLNR